MKNKSKLSNMLSAEANASVMLMKESLNEAKRRKYAGGIFTFNENTSSIPLQQPASGLLSAQYWRHLARSQWRKPGENIAWRMAAAASA
jgi:hypothetical protein